MATIVQTVMMLGHLWINTWPLAILLLFLGEVWADELMSARCQANCLYEFEKTAKAQGVKKRQLKHMVIQLCRNDLNCSSCAKPCRESFESVTTCFTINCLGAKVAESCYASCKFLDEAHRNKPGTCLAQTVSLEYTNECISSCRHDADCAADSKCCGHGCGTRCSRDYSPDQTLLPRPTDVSVQERKRGRSVNIRWVMSKLTQRHLATHANLFVVQWRWGVGPEQQEMTPWQTISIRNKLFAIVKHLLSPGRFYQFRVAAVNKNGSLGFSNHSAVFRLSKSPKAPGKPENLQPGAADFENGWVYQNIKWLSPGSDLPIVHYQVTWSEAMLSNVSIEMLSDAPERSELLTHKSGSKNRLKDSNESKIEDNENSDEFFHFIPSRTVLVPGDKTTARLPRLRPGTRYLVEVHAIALSENDEWHGEKAAIYIVASRPTSATSTGFPGSPALSPDVRPSASASNSVELDYQPFMRPRILDVHVGKPYYHNGLLKALVTWNYSGPEPDSTSFSLVWWPTVCLGTPFSEFSVSKPLSHNVETNTFELFDLHFDCHYSVNISSANNARAIPSTISQGQFETPKCQDTPVRGDVKPNCPKMPDQVPSVPRNLTCRVSSTQPAHTPASERLSNNPHVSQPKHPLIFANCSWDAPFRVDSPITGYRVVMGQKMMHNFGISDASSFPSLDRNSVVIKTIKPEQLSIQLDRLLPGCEFLVQVRAVSEAGMSRAAFAQFHTPSSTSKSAASKDYAIQDSIQTIVPNPAKGRDRSSRVANREVNLKITTLPARSIVNNAESLTFRRTNLFVWCLLPHAWIIPITLKLLSRIADVRW